MARKPAKPPTRDPDELLALAQQHAERDELVEAEACYREVLKVAPDHLGALTLLGFLLVDRGEFHSAIDMLERARDGAPGFAPIHLALGAAYADAGHDGLAVTAMETAVKLDSTSTIPLERLAKLHIRARRNREAIGVLRRVLRRDPSHAEARFLLAGLTGDRSMNLESPPPALIADLFDTYAPTFEQHLVEDLKYSVPKALAKMLVELGLPADRSRRVIDLGCGTGLAGVELRPYARELIGVDLSPRMIERARARGIYDELKAEDLAATLARVSDVDWLVAADVLIYVGVLDATFAACARVLRPGGMLAFSIERSDGDDLVLQSTLRYSHSDAYVRRLAAANAFTVERAEPMILRVNDDQPAHGIVYILRR